MKHWNRLLGLVLSLCMLGLLAAGCGNQPQENDPPVVDPISDPDPVDDPEPIIDPEPTKAYNRLTGEYNLAVGSETDRPIALSINNTPVARPQFGLDQADWFFEMETEGGVTRILAVFPNAQAIPAQAGSIRSARTQFVKIVKAIDAVYLHCGGSTLGEQLIKDLGVGDLDAMSYEGTTYWRDLEIYNGGLAWEHCLMTNGEKVAERLTQNQMRTTTDTPLPFIFDDVNAEKTGNSAKEVEVKISGFQTVNFVYNETDGQYYKNNGTLTDSTPHVTRENTQVHAKNVIVMYDNLYQEDSAHVSFELNSGSGLYFVNGVQQPITWKRSNSALSFMGEDGQPLKILPGKTYVCLVNNKWIKSTIAK